MVIKKEEENDKEVLKDGYERKLNLKSVDHYLYLGYLIQGDGSNYLTIKENVAKGQGAAKEILLILEGVYLGHYLEILN